MTKKDQDELKIALPDNITPAQARFKQLREESDKLEAEKAERDKERLAREEQRRQLQIEEDHRREDALIPLISSGETREQLYARMQEIRQEAVKPADELCRAPHITPRIKTQIEEEMEAGRRAVARNQAQLDATRDLRARLEAEQKAKEGHMTPVYVPNPVQGQQQFPTSKR
jgi:hypothetical protein